jgi:hypothetical protein
VTSERIAPLRSLPDLGDRVKGFGGPASPVLGDGNRHATRSERILKRRNIVGARSRGQGDRSVCQPRKPYAPGASPPWNWPATTSAAPALECDSNGRRAAEELRSSLPLPPRESRFAGLLPVSKCSWWMRAASLTFCRLARRGGAGCLADVTWLGWIIRGLAG